MKNEKAVDSWLSSSPLSQKGVKGFQPIGLEEKKDVRQAISLSHRQMRVLNQLSREMDMSKPDIIRIALFEYLTKHNFNTDGSILHKNTRSKTT